MNRREFLGAIAAAAAGNVVAAEKTVPADETAGGAGAKKSLLGSAPVLQNAAETSIGVVFEVTDDASGWVDVSRSPDMSDARRFYSGERGLMKVDPRVAQVRIAGLNPATRYWYRIGADRIDFAGGYKMRNLGAEQDQTVHSFETLGARLGTVSQARTPSEGVKFCVINDTHENKPTLRRVFDKIAEIKSHLVIWNGDASNVSEDVDGALKVFVHPHEDFEGYAADTPYIFLNGNHDFRGRYNRHLEDLMMLRDCDERPQRFGSLGRNFCVRLGDMALIGLDTGEDKLDDDERFAGIFRMKEYRELQAEWLAETVESEKVKTARHKVAFCHIPLFDPRPQENPGDVPRGKDGYKTDYASWQRFCANIWGPSLAKAGVRLVVSGHQHRFRFEPADGGRGWAQLVGGGPKIHSGNLEYFPTVIECSTAQNGIAVKVHDLANGRIVMDQVV